MQIIRISDDIVELQDVTAVKRTRLTDFYRALTHEAGYRSPFLPSGTVHFATRGRMSNYTIESPPAPRTVQYRDGERPVQEYTVPFPWMYLLVSFTEQALDGVRVYFSAERLSKDEDVLSHAPLPNRYSDGSVCLGNFRFEVASTAPDRIEKVCDFFASSTYTNEILDSFNDFVPEEITAKTRSGENCFSGWARIPEKAVSKVKWKPYRKFSVVLEEILNRR